MVNCLGAKNNAHSKWRRKRQSANYTAPGLLIAEPHLVDVARHVINMNIVAIDLLA